MSVFNKEWTGGMKGAETRREIDLVWTEWLSEGNVELTVCEDNGLRVSPNLHA